MTNAGIMASLTSDPVAIFPVAALGLVVVGFFVRVVMKISLAHRQRIAVDRDHSNWTDERPEPELHDDQFVQQQLEVTDYLQSPLLPTQTDSDRFVRAGLMASGRTALAPGILPLARGTGSRTEAKMGGAAISNHTTPSASIPVSPTPSKN